MAQQNIFRSDLLYRLSVFKLHLPPLQARQEDIPTLAKHFLDKFNQKFSKNIQGISPNLLQKMQSRNWPGNVRELENILEQAVVMSNREILADDALPGEIVNEISSAPIPIKWDNFKTYRKNTIQKLDQEYLNMLLALVDGNYSAAARLAGISRIQLYRMKNIDTF